MTTPTTPIPGGCILLARKMLDSDLMEQSPLVVKLWIWILLKANWKDRDKLQRGELVTTISEMQTAMNYYSGWRKMSPSLDQVRSAYGALRDTARVTVRRTTRGMVISVVNFDSYQDLTAYASHTGTHKGKATLPAAIPHDTEEREIKNLKPIASNKSSQQKAAIYFDFSTGKFSGIESHSEVWVTAYPATDIDAELARAAAWLIANPKNRKSNYARFLNSWLSRSQDRAPKQTSIIPIPVETTIPALTTEQIRQTMERRYATE